jgi:signal transduction histidine kinase
MYGWINACLENLVISQYGVDLWLKIRSRAFEHFDPQVIKNLPQNGDNTILFNRNIDYPDIVTYELIKGAIEELQVTQNVLIERLGTYFVHFLRDNGYESTLKMQGKTFLEWLDHLNEPHRLLRSRFSHAHTPSFWIELPTSNNDHFEIDNNHESVILHYISPRGEMFNNLVVGIIRESARLYFYSDVLFRKIVEDLSDPSALHYAWALKINSNEINQDIPKHETETTYSTDSNYKSCPFSCFQMEVSSTTISSKVQDGAQHSSHCPFDHDLAKYSTSLQNEANNPASTDVLPTSRDSVSLPHSTCESGLSAQQLCSVFPFHFAVDSSLRMTQCGERLTSILKSDMTTLSTQPLIELFSWQHPATMNWNWNSLRAFAASGGNAGSEIEICALPPDLVIYESFTRSPNLLLRGNLLLTALPDGRESALFLVNPDLQNLQELSRMNLTLSDLTKHSFQRDVVLLGEHVKQETKISVSLDTSNRILERDIKWAQSALNAKRMFVRYVSHEIRTPLHITLLGLSHLDQLLKVEDEQESKLCDTEIVTLPTGESNQNQNKILQEVRNEVSQTLAEVHGSCEVAVNVVNDLLLFEKLDSGLFSLVRSHVDVHQLVWRVCRLFAVQARSVGVKLQSNAVVSNTGVMVLADEQKLEQVLRNLVSNALKFTPQGGSVMILLEVISRSMDVTSIDDEDIVFADTSTTSQSDSESLFTRSLLSNAIPSLATNSEDSQIRDQFLRISVSDSGVGVRQSEKQELFRQFAQSQYHKCHNEKMNCTESSKTSVDSASARTQVMGSGLGLWIASIITSMHGGRLGVRSDGPGGGSTFLIDLPLL